jgi:iron complex outermembrane recepter protein
MKRSLQSASTQVDRHVHAVLLMSMLASLAIAGQAHAQVGDQGASASVQSQAVQPAKLPPQKESKKAKEVQLLQEVVVTGTQIHGVSAPIGSELLSLGVSQIQDSGQQTTADILRSLPMVSSIGPGEDVTNSSADLGSLNITRETGINLRGLGTNATLVLLDGRRLAPGGEGAQLFDPSQIPAIALQRIDVMPDGASAIYGADAVGGVVNLIVRRNFNGAEIDVSDGFAQDFDGQVRADAIAGHEWSTGSFMIAGEFFTHPSLLADSRPSLYDDDQAPFGGSDLQNEVGAPGNISVDGTLYGLPPGNGVGVTPAEFSTAIHRTSQWADDTPVPSQQRESFVLSAQQQLGDRVNAWIEGYYSDTNTNSLDGPYEETALQVPSSNPFFIPGAAGPCSSGSGLCDSVNYSFINDVGVETTKNGEESYQLALGADVDLGRDFVFSFYGTTSMDREQDLFTGLNGAAVNAALALSNPATALNVMGSGGNNNPATLATLVGWNNFLTRYDMNLLHAQVDGPIFNLPAGPVRLAIGTEYHGDQMHEFNYGDTSTTSTDLFQTSVLTTDSRRVASVYGEAVVPVFAPNNAVPGIRRLTLDVAGRFDHYSDFGSTTNPKFGLNWDPVNDLTFHASYGKSFRAPNLCDINPLCTGGLVVLPFPDNGWYKDNPPSVFGPGVSLTAIEVGGNPKLKPETASEYTTGADWHPQWIQNFDVSVDYYYIDYKNIIDTPAAFNPDAGLLPEYAPFIIRNPTLAQVLAAYATPGPAPAFPPQLVNLIVNGRRVNVGAALTDGLDLSLRKLWATSWGDWFTGLNGTYVLKYDYSLVPGLPLVDVLNTVQGSGNAYPLRFTARGQLGWSKFGFNVNGFVNFHNSYTNTAPPSPLPNETIASYTTVDLSVAYDTGNAAPWNGFNNMTISVSALDLFNRLPPFALVGTQDFDSTTGSPLGRLVTIELRKRF